MDSRFTSKIMLLEEIQVTTETSSSATDASTSALSSTSTAELTETPTEAPTEATRLSVEQLRFVSEHASCAMCDSELETRHQVNKAELRLREEAHCPSCGIRVRSSQHLLH